MHIPPHDNDNRPIIDINDAKVPYAFFNRVTLNRDEEFVYELKEYESCIVPVTGSIIVNVYSLDERLIGNRINNVWDGEPEGVYVPTGLTAKIKCACDHAEIFIAGAKYSEQLQPFYIMGEDVDVVQYGSDDTKTHRKIKHILGQKQNEKVGRLLVSELFTVGKGGWSGFPPHKHDTDRDGETHHDEVYNFRFDPKEGFALQLLQGENKKVGDAHHIVDGSTFVIDKGYHPCVVAPGYQMYYFTILAGKSQRSLVQYFQPEYSWQVETIPGIKDMIAKFK